MARPGGGHARRGGRGPRAHRPAPAAHRRRCRRRDGGRPAGGRRAGARARSARERRDVPAPRAWRSRRWSRRSPPTSASSSGSRSPRTSCPRRPACWTKPWSWRRRPASGSTSRSAARRALGLAGHFPDAMDLCRRGLAHATDVAPEAVARLEAELVCNASLHAAGVPEVRARLLRPAVPAATLELWRPNAAMRAMFGGQPAGDVLELLRPALNGDALTSEPDSLLNSRGDAGAHPRAMSSGRPARAAPR